MCCHLTANALPKLGCTNSPLVKVLKLPHFDRLEFDVYEAQNVRQNCFEGEFVESPQVLPIDDHCH